MVSALLHFESCTQLAAALEDALQSRAQVRSVQVRTLIRYVGLLWPWENWNTRRPAAGKPGTTADR